MIAPRRRQIWLKLAVFSAAASAGCSSLPYGIHFPQPIAVAKNEYRYIQEGHLHRAISYSTGSMNAWPNFHGNYALRALAYYKKGMYEQAISDYSKAISMKSDVWDLYRDRGRAYLSLGMHDEGYADLARSIALRDNAPARAERGILLARRGRFQEALADGDKAVELDASLDAAHAARGAALIGLKRYQDALPDIDRYLDGHPDDIRFLLLQGVAYYRLGRTEKARAVAEEILHFGSRLNAAFFGDRMLACSISKSGGRPSARRSRRPRRPK